MAESELGEALSTYVSRAAEKLRAQGSVAGALQVFVMTNVFREADPQYSNGIVIPLPDPNRPDPTNNTLKLVALTAQRDTGAPVEAQYCIPQGRLYEALFLTEKRQL